MILHKLVCQNPACNLIILVPSDMFDRTFSIEELQLCPACELEELSFHSILSTQDIQTVKKVFYVSCGA